MSARTTLHANPFHVLGVTTRDDGRTIIDKAEERSLSIDPDVCQKARSELTNPRTRLVAEMAWMPGVAPRTAEGLVDTLSGDPASWRSDQGLPELAQANVMAAALELLSEGETSESVARLMCDFASVVEAVSAGDVLRDVNEDRTVSGFPQVQDINAVEAAFAEQRKVYLSVLRNVLDRMETGKLIETMTAAVSLATDHGEEQGPALLDDLIDTVYEVEAQGFLRPEHDNIVALVQRAKEAAPSGEAAVAPVVDKLDAVVQNWDRVAQPIQLSAKSRGIVHRQSREIALDLRNLGVQLANNHQMIESAGRMIELAQETFAELPEMAERLEEDLLAIDGLRADKEAWAREISFRAEVGLFPREELAVSAEGIRWKGRTFPLESITGVRWGGVRYATGADFTVAFRDGHLEQVVNMSKEATFGGFINALWRAVGVRLMIEMLRDLSDGKSLSWGDIRVEDGGVTLARHRLFGASEHVRLTWDKVQVWSADGRLHIGKKTDRSTFGSMSYLDHWNVHILENAIRGGLDKGVLRLSDFLRG